jgi:osmotically inducible protein OsmC
MIRLASATWHGGLKNGVGIITTESGVLKETLYSFGARCEGQSGNNPEELLAAALAACFTMTLAAELEKAGLVPENIRTAAGLTLEKLEGGWTVTKIHLDLTANLPKADWDKFAAAANAAKDGCPVSRLLNTKITLDAKLDSSKSVGKAAREPVSIPSARLVIPISLEEEYEYHVSTNGKH